MEKRLYLIKEWIDTDEEGEKVYNYIVFDQIAKVADFLKESSKPCSVWRIEKLSGIS